MPAQPPKIPSNVLEVWSSHSHLGSELAYCTADGQSFVVVDYDSPDSLEKVAVAVQELYHLWQPPLPLLRLDIPELGKGQANVEQALNVAWAKACNIPPAKRLGEMWWLRFWRDLPQQTSLIFVTGGQRLNYWALYNLRLDTLGVLAVIAGQNLSPETLPQESTLLRRAISLTAAEAVAVDGE